MIKLLPTKDKLLGSAAPLLKRIRRYHVFLFILTFLSIYGFLIMRVGNLTQSEPPAVELDTSQNAIRRLRLDQASINQLKELEAQNIEVRALFKQARDNPFTE